MQTLHLPARRLAGAALLALLAGLAALIVAGGVGGSEPHRARLPGPHARQAGGPDGALRRWPAADIRVGAPAATAPATPAPSPAYDGTLGGVPLQRARCAQWRTAGPAPRRQAVRGLSATIGGPSTSGGLGATLPERQVAGLFDRYCATSATRGFLLYVIYARAAGLSAGAGTP